MKKYLIIFWLGTLLFAVDDDSKSPRFIVHILDYLAIDYGGAVQNGKVIEPSEYQEQIEFSTEALRLAEELPGLKDDRELVAKFRQLKKMVLDKKEENQVASLAREIETKIISTQAIELYPRRWPNLAKGKKHFEENCAQCHGQTGKGDGPSGNSLDPKPANFHAERAKAMSPFQFYNSIRLGVPGTAMASFSSFSDEEIWNLAFYSASLKYGASKQLNSEPKISLKELASKSDLALKERQEELSLARTYQVSESAELESLTFASNSLVEALKEYKNHDKKKAKEAAIAAYLEGVEPVEARLRNSDPALTVQIEKTMADFRNAIQENASDVRVEELMWIADKKIEAARIVLSKPAGSSWMIGSLAGGIFLREAFEAVLILITLLGVIRSIGVKGAAIYVHMGWITALALGLLTWVFSGWLMHMSGATRELLEGVISLFAVFVLLYFGFWLHTKTEMGKWRAFINKTVLEAVNKKKLIALGMVAFLGVFREVFETVLFLRALLLEVGESGEHSLFLGVGISFLIVLVSSTIAVRMSARLPLRQLFAVSSFVMALLSLILVGKAIHSFQETGIVSMTHLPFTFRSELFGIFPTYQTLIPQCILLAACLFYWWTTKNRVNGNAH